MIHGLVARGCVETTECGRARFRLVVDAVGGQIGVSSVTFTK